MERKVSFNAGVKSLLKLIWIHNLKQFKVAKYDLKWLFFFPFFQIYVYIDIIWIFYVHFKRPCANNKSKTAQKKVYWERDSTSIFQLYYICTSVASIRFATFFSPSVNGYVRLTQEKKNISILTTSLCEAIKNMTSVVRLSLATHIST